MSEERDETKIDAPAAEPQAAPPGDDGQPTSCVDDRAAAADAAVSADPAPADGAPPAEPAAPEPAADPPPPEPAPFDWEAEAKRLEAALAAKTAELRNASRLLDKKARDDQKLAASLRRARQLEAEAAEKDSEAKKAKKASEAAFEAHIKLEEELRSGQQELPLGDPEPPPAKPEKPQADPASPPVEAPRIAAAPEPAKAPEPDDAWRSFLVADLTKPDGTHLKRKTVESLAEQDPPITTLGQLADYSKSRKQLTDIPGIGPKAAEDIDAACEHFWSRRALDAPRPEPPPADEANEKLKAAKAALAQTWRARAIDEFLSNPQTAAKLHAQGIHSAQDLAFSAISGLLENYPTIDGIERSAVLADFETFRRSLTDDEAWDLESFQAEHTPEDGGAPPAKPKRKPRKK
jgi:hypothetical protein